MEQGNVIEIRGLRKTFKVRSDRDHGLFQRPVEKTVIDGIDLDIRKGETLGIIGSNGAGKSTLLKILSGILEPDGGEIRFDGRVASILELGMGFHYDLSGAENIRIMCGYYGMNRDRVDSIFDTIVEYSELGDAINDPVKTYSSGMSARLAMAILVNIDAEIMIVDEVLSVGDASFSAKSRGHFSRLIASGRTVVLTSHRLRTIETGSDRVVWLDKGRIRMIGDPREVCEAYAFEMTGSDSAVEALAEAGDPQSQYKLAKRIEGTDPERYAELVDSSADGGWGPANREVAHRLAGEGRTDEASERYLAALRTGDRDSEVPYSVVRAGMSDELRMLESVLRDRYRDGDPFYGYNLAQTIFLSDPSRAPEAADLLRSSWEEGNADAGYALARMLIWGDGIPASPEKGIEIMEAAAVRGHYRALQTMSSLYLDGRLVPKDPEKAFRWNLTAARAGVQRAQFTVACMYRDGIGTERDDTEADRWFAASVRSKYLDQYLAASKASSDDPDVTARLCDMLLSTCNQRAIGQAERMGVDGRSSGPCTDPRGRMRAAMAILEGGCSDEEAAIAVGTLEELAASGMPEAMMALAGLYKDGRHVTADEERYKGYIRKAAELGNRRAAIIVGRWDRRNDRRRRKRSRR